MSTYIYGLCDPREPEKIMYVGKSNRLDARLRDHLNPKKCGPQNAWLNRWITNLVSDGVQPQMNILESVLPGSWKRRERFWIAQWRELNPELLNIQDGGNGADFVNDETRRRLSVSGIGKTHSEETKAQMRESAKTRPPETWDYMRGEGNPAKRPEVRKKLSDRQRGADNARGFLGKHHTEKAKEVMSKNNGMKRPDVVSQFKKPKSEETRMKMRAAQLYRRALERRARTTFGWEDVIAS